MSSLATSLQNLPTIALQDIAVGLGAPLEYVVKLTHMGRDILVHQILQRHANIELVRQATAVGQAVFAANQHNRLINIGAALTVASLLTLFVGQTVLINYFADKPVDTSSTLPVNKEQEQALFDCRRQHAKCEGTLFARRKELEESAKIYSNCATEKLELNAKADKFESMAKAMDISNDKLIEVKNNYKQQLDSCTAAFKQCQNKPVNN